jgi:hypothetical protein
VGLISSLETASTSRGQQANGLAVLPFLFPFGGEMATCGYDVTPFFRIRLWLVSSEYAYGWPLST